MAKDKLIYGQIDLPQRKSQTQDNLQDKTLISIKGHYFLEDKARRVIGKCMIKYDFG